MKVNSKTVTAVIVPVILFGIGCAHRKAIVKDTFLLEPKRNAVTAQTASEKILAVQPFSIAPAFEGKGVVSCIGENQYESDFYNEYFVSPAQMVTEQTRYWLSQSGLFARVLAPVSSVQATHVLEGHIQKMVLDIREPEKPRAKMEITFFLIEQHKHDRTIRFQQTYSAAHSMQSRFTQDYIAAQSRCLHDILEKLEMDMASHL